MLRGARQIFLALVLMLPNGARAEREVHVVSVANGSRDPINLMSIHEAHVHVNRAGHNVTLVLMDRGPVTWRITQSDGTFIEDILIAGDRPARSEVVLNGIPFEGSTVDGLPVTLAPLGKPFRRLVSDLTARVGVDQLTGFYGAYDAPLDPIVIGRSRALPAFSPDYLADALGPLDDLPEAITLWTLPADTPERVLFDENGFELRHPDGVMRFAPPPEITPLMFPTGAAYDSENGMIYGMTLGGRGSVYGVDTATGFWRIIGSQDHFDGAQMIFDGATQRIIMTGAFTRPGEIRVMGLDGQAAQFTIPATDFAGLTDLYDYGNEDAPSLVPVDVSGEWVVLVARDTEGLSNRVYAVHLQTGDIRLLSFEDHS